MYLFYVDETGNLDPQVEGMKEDGTRFEKDWIYVLTAFGIFEHKWKKFYYSIVNKKRDLIEKTCRPDEDRLNLSQCEIKSNWLRIEKERIKHPFLSRLSEEDIKDLVKRYYDQLDNIHLTYFSIVVDKRYLESYFDSHKLHRKAWELLCERIENFMREYHGKHKAILITDDVNKKANISLAMKHSYFLEQGTTANVKLKHILEMPLFVSSELSEGIQFADLCSYNVYHAFKYNDLNYSYFKMLYPLFYKSQNTDFRKKDGLKVFPDASPLQNFVDSLS